MIIMRILVSRLGHKAVIITKTLICVISSVPQDTMTPMSAFDHKINIERYRTDECSTKGRGVIMICYIEGMMQTTGDLISVDYIKTERDGKTVMFDWDESEVSFDTSCDEKGFRKFSGRLKGIKFGGEYANGRGAELNNMQIREIVFDNPDTEDTEPRMQIRLVFEPWECGNWWDMMHNPQTFVVDGRLLYRYKQKQAEEYVKAKGFAVEFEGHKAFAVNHGLISSDFFETVDDGSYDMFIGFSYNGGSGKWSYSLRAAKDDVDVSKIAVKYGGGGHKGAAGFTVEEYVLGEMKDGEIE